jgi:hypothetical protein
MSTFANGPVNVLPESLICLKCRYSLRGLAASGACPECATPIERSMQGDLLSFSGAGYVSKLNVGATLIMTALALVMLGVIIPVMMGIVAATRLGFGGGWPLIVMMLVGGGLLLSGSVVYLVGWWKVASPDPSQLGDDRGERPRLYVRWAVLLTLCMQVVSVMVAFGSFPTWFTEALGLLNRLITSVGLLAGLLYVKWLAGRVPSERVRKRSGTLIVLCSILIALNLATTLARFTGVLSVVTKGNLGAMGFVTVAVGLLFLVTFVMYYNLFSWLRKDLGKVLDGMRG